MTGQACAGLEEGELRSGWKMCEKKKTVSRGSLYSNEEVLMRRAQEEMRPTK